MDDLEKENDEKIVRLVQSGKTEAFGILVERYKEKISRYGKKFLSNREGKTFDVMFPTSSGAIFPDFKEGEPMMIMGKKIGEKIFLKGFHEPPEMFFLRPSVK